MHKELQDTIAQLEAIRHEIRSISFVNPGPMTRRLIDDPNNTSVGNGIAADDTNIFLMQNMVVLCCIMSYL